MHACENPRPIPPGIICYDCDGNVVDPAAANIEGGTGDESAKKIKCFAINGDNSIISTLTLSHHQIARDYGVGRGSASCRDCGSGVGSGASLFELNLQRRHRYRDMTTYSSFGPGVYNRYDTKLSIYEYDGGIMAELFEPQDLAPRKFVDGLEGDTKDGVLRNLENKGFKDLRLYDGADTLTSSLASAQKAILTSHNGITHTFELVQMESFTGIIGGQANTPLIDPANLPGTDLVSHWEFNEGTGSTAGDSEGSYDGTINGGAWVTSGAPSGGAALSFDGNGDEVNAGNVPVGSAGGTNGGFTAAFWVNPGTQIRNYPVMLSKYKGASGERSFMVDGYKNGGKLRFHLYNLNGTSGATLVTPQEVIVRDTWQHVAVTYDGNFQRIFVNGIQVAQSANLDADFSTARSADLIIGSRGGAAYQANQFVGEMDDVRLYERPLTAPELKAVMERELLANYDFEENTGTTTADGSGNGNAGTLFGGASWTTGGFAGNAIDFDGVDDGVNLGNDAAILSPHWITVAAWVKPDTLANASGGNGARNIIAKGDGVFLRVKDGQYQVGTGNNIRATFDAPSGDVGEWVHLAGTFDGQRWRLYRNGVLVGIDTHPTGASAGDEEWVVANQADGTRPFDGVIDDLYIYNYALSDDEIASLSELPLKGGRLVEIADRNGFAKTITYRDSDFTAQELSDAPDRRWQIRTVTDAYGREATFHYKSTQESGRWVVERIDLPNTEDINYVYDSSGRLSTVDHADGTQSTFDYGVDSTSQTTTVTYRDASAAGTHRNKTVYLTNMTVTAGLAGAELYSQSSLMVRVVANGSNEVSFYASNVNPSTKLIYSGEGELSLHRLVTEVRNYEDGWSFNTPGDPGSGVSGTLESSFATAHEGNTEQNYVNMATGAYRKIKDSDGLTYHFQYDGDNHQTRKTYPDNTTEKWEYNSFKQVTKHTDRLGRQTVNTYDAAGNLLSREVGILNGVNQPEYAKFEHAYYNGSEGPTVAGITGAAATQPKGLKKSDTDANGNTTHYVYDSNNFRIAMIEPADRVGDDRAVTIYDYDSAGRMSSVTDPIGRVTTFTYDARDRQKTVTYHDGSTEETFYANELAGGAGHLANLVVASKDRNGNYTQFRYDSHGRRVITTRGIKTQADALDLSFEPDTTYHDVEKCVYLDGTNKKIICTRNGERTEYLYDYRHRQVATTVHPRDEGVFPFNANLIDPDGTGPLASGDDPGELVSATIYKDNLRFASVDPYGRATFYAYRSSDSALIRTVRETVPGGSGIDLDTGGFTDVINLTRDLSFEDAATLGATATGGGAAYLITDMVKDAEAQTTSTVDPRNIQHDTVYDSRGRTIESVTAVGTTVQAKSQTVYDAQSNVIESRTPRYFDVSDTEGLNKAFTAMTYTGRNLLATKTVAAGDTTYDDFVTNATGLGARATVAHYYYLDGTHDKTIDFNGNDPQFTAADHEVISVWRDCCRRLRATIDQEGHGNAQGTDFNGNVTHTAVVDSLISDVIIDSATGARTIADSDYNGIPGYWDAPDTRTLAETTTRFDSKNRPIASTVWLDKLGLVDPNDPPILYNAFIKGGARAQTAASDLGAGDGLTTLYYYSEDIYQTPFVSVGIEGPPIRGAGEDNAYLVHQFSGAPSIDLNPTLNKLEALDIIIFRDDYSNASARATINPEGEITLTIMDGIGRPVIAAMLDPTTFEPVTWSTISLDRVSDAIAVTFGDTLETLSISALEHLNRSLTDGVGRTIEAEDAEGKVAYAIYDNNGNAIRTRDANAVGNDCDFDARNRRISCTDTQGDTTTATYNANNQFINVTDGKGVANKADTVYDARGRLIESTSRLLAADKNTRTYDPNSNLLTQTDAQANTTTYHYNSRNLRTATDMPGHNPTAVVGDADYDRHETTYDAQRRPQLKTHTNGDTCVLTYDLASRLLAKDYRLAINSTPLTSGLPTGGISDTDAFTYDDASRPLTAIKGRYTNTVAYTYDQIGRPTSEALTTHGVTYTVGYTSYDDDSRLTTLTYPDGSKVTTTYTDRNQAEDVDYTLSGGAATTLASHTYDAGMRNTLRELGNGLDVTRAYRSGDNLLESITVAGKAGLSLDYTYDANKNMTAEDMGGVMDDYGSDLVQDAKDRMTTWTRDTTNTSLDSQSWSLSFENNWDDTTRTDAGTGVTESRTHSGVHELLSLDPDDAGPITPIAQTHDAKGNLSNDGSGRAFTHDFDNMISSVTVSPGASLGTVGTHSYTYDALGRRVSKTTGGVTTVYVCSGNQVIAEYTGGAASAAPDRKYIYCLTCYIDEPIALIDATGASEATYYYHRNRQFSIIGLSDSSGGVVERYAYTAYGDPTILAPNGTTTRTTSDYDNTYLHTGRRYDEESELYYYRSRMYDALLGRFLQRDPLGYPDGLNTYAAYHVMRGELDPWGLSEYQWHHLYPRQIFGPGKALDLKKQVGIDIDSRRSGWWLKSEYHSQLHNKNNGGRNWNEEWSSWLDDMKDEGVVDRKGNVLDKNKFKTELAYKRSKLINDNWDLVGTGTGSDTDYKTWRRETTQQKDQRTANRFYGNGRSTAVAVTAAVGASAFATSAFGFATGIAQGAGSDPCLQWYRATYRALYNKSLGKYADCGSIARGNIYENCKWELQLNGANASWIGFVESEVMFEKLAQRASKACRRCDKNFLKEASNSVGK